MLVEVVLAATSRQEKREGSYHPRFLPHKVNIEKKGEGRTHLCADFPRWALPLSAGGVAVVAVRHHLLVLSLLSAASPSSSTPAGVGAIVAFRWHLQLQASSSSLSTPAAAGVGAVVAVHWHLQLQALSSLSTPAAAGGVAVVAFRWHLQLQVLPSSPSVGTRSCRRRRCRCRHLQLQVDVVVVVVVVC